MPVKKTLIKKYRAFSRHNPEKEKVVNFPIDDGLYFLGYADRIGYQSDKRERKGNFYGYDHRFKNPYPKMYANKAGNCLIILGNFTVNERGIVG